MTTFMIEFDFERCHYECYVQKLKDKDQYYYLLNFKDSELINLVKGKRMVLSASDNPNAGNDLLRLQAWNAIAKKEAAF